MEVRGDCILSSEDRLTLTRFQGKHVSDLGERSVVFDGKHELVTRSICDQSQLFLHELRPNSDGEDVRTCLAQQPRLVTCRFHVM